jgi:hypothetical protein
MGIFYSKHQDDENCLLPRHYTGPKMFWAGANSFLPDQLLLGSYYKYWSYKCFNTYFLDQPVRIFVNGGKFSNQYV